MEETQTFKRHLVSIGEMRQPFESMPRKSLDPDERDRLRDGLERIRTEVNQLMAVHQTENDELLRITTELFLSRRVEEKARCQSTIDFLEDKIQRMESLASSFL